MQFLFGLFLIVATGCAIAQQYSTTPDTPSLPDAIQLPSPEPPGSESASSKSPGAAALPDAPSYTSHPPSTVSPETASLSPMSKRYLNLSMPSSVGDTSLIFVGGKSSFTKAGGSYPQPDGSASGTGKNCSGGSAGKTDGGGWINSLISVTSKSGHYCALGEGGFWKRGTYAAARAFAAHRYDYANSFNSADAFGLAVTPGVPSGYYPYQNYAGERLAARYASAVGRDTLKNMFREFWPDFSTHMLHRHP